MWYGVETRESWMKRFLYGFAILTVLVITFIVGGNYYALNSELKLEAEVYMPKEDEYSIIKRAREELLLKDSSAVAYFCSGFEKSKSGYSVTFTSSCANWIISFPLGVEVGSTSLCITDFIVNMDKEGFPIIKSGEDGGVRKMLNELMGEEHF